MSIFSNETIIMINMRRGLSSKRTFAFNERNAFNCFTLQCWIRGTSLYFFQNNGAKLRKNKLLSPTHIFNEPNEKYFVFSDWLELSKRRVYLTVKYCYHLHKRYANTLLEVERSPPSMLRFIEEVSNRAELVKNHLTGATYQKDENNSGLDDYSSDYTSSNAPSECANSSFNLNSANKVLLLCSNSLKY